MSSADSIAQAIAERIRTQAARPQNITVRELIERRMAVYAGRDTALRARLIQWQVILGDFTLEQLDAEIMRTAREEIARTAALSFKGLDHEGREIFKPKATGRKKTPATVNRYMAALSGVFTWAAEERLTPHQWANPCRGIRRMREPAGRVRFLDEGERGRLFEACKASRYPRLQALALMAMLTGARKGELLSLTWRDVDLEQGVARLGRTKNGDRRTLVLLPQVIEALRPFVGEAQRFVFGSVRSRYLQPAKIDTAWKQAILRAKVKDFRFHDLRHCCASYLAQAGKDLNVIAEVLGHRKLDMTRRYSHLTVQNKAEAMRDALGGIGVHG